MKPTPRFSLYILVAAIVACLFFASCVTAEDTHKIDAAQQSFDAARAAAEADLAAGVPPAQVQEAMRAALAEYTEQMKGAGRDVANRTASLWDALKADPLGGGITLLLSQLPLLLGLNARRNATRKTDPKVANALRTN